MERADFELRPPFRDERGHAAGDIRNAAAGPAQDGDLTASLTMRCRSTRRSVGTHSMPGVARCQLASVATVTCSASKPVRAREDVRSPRPRRVVAPNDRFDLDRPVLPSRSLRRAPASYRPSAIRRASPGDSTSRPAVPAKPHRYVMLVGAETPRARKLCALAFWCARWIRPLKSGRDDRPWGPGD